MNPADLRVPRPATKPETPDAAALTAAATALLRAVPDGAGLATRVLVRWNPRLVSTAGRAFAARATVELNPKLPAFPGETERTLRHELAHLLAAWRARGGGRLRGRRIAPHGPEWRQACAELGIPGEPRCHRLGLPRRAPAARRHTYRCPGCGFQLRRVRPIPKRRPLACRACCRSFARGRFDRRFLFVAVAGGDAAQGCAPCRP